VLARLKDLGYLTLKSDDSLAIRASFENSSARFHTPRTNSRDGKKCRR
jgi:hypothetical protein